MEIRQLTDAAEKQAVTRLILEALPEWFGIPEAREEYIRESAGRIFFCAYDRTRPVGFLCLKETGNATVELYVMGIRKEYHRQGIGRLLFRQAREAASGAGYAFMQVKTVQMGKYEEYDRTNRFYLAWASGSLRCSPPCGTNGTPARCTSCPWNRPQISLDSRGKTCYSQPVRGDDGCGSPEPREEMPAGGPVTGARVWMYPNSGGTTDVISFALSCYGSGRLLFCIQKHHIKEI